MTVQNNFSNINRFSLCNDRSHIQVNVSDSYFGSNRFESKLAAERTSENFCVLFYFSRT